MAWAFTLRRQGADGLRDQEMARVFPECGWTQEKVAGRGVWAKGQLSSGEFRHHLQTRIAPLFRRGVQWFPKMDRRDAR
jgi:hypothetical protein